MQSPYQGRGLSPDMMAPVPQTVGRVLGRCHITAAATGLRPTHLSIGLGVYDSAGTTLMPAAGPV